MNILIKMRTAVQNGVDSGNILFTKQNLYLEKEFSKRSAFSFYPGPQPSFQKYFWKVPICDTDRPDVIWTQAHCYGRCPVPETLWTEDNGMARFS